MNLQFLQYLPKAQQERLSGKIGEILLTRALAALHDALPKQAQDELAKILKNKDEAAQIQFLGAHQAEFQKAMIDESLKLDRELEEGMAGA